MEVEWPVRQLFVDFKIAYPSGENCSTTFFLTWRTDGYGYVNKICLKETYT
jgi:hypothetical protein